MENTETTVSIFILLLLVASSVAIATKFIKVPYTLGLVLIGLLISPMHFLPVVHVSPGLILLVFLPALLFEAAWNLHLAEFRRNLLPILSLAVAGVCLSVGVVGFVLYEGLGMSWDKAMLFGSMIAATDPVSVLALFRSLGLPKRLATIVEGESLFNDGTTVVVFRILLGIVVGTTTGTPGEILLSSAREFFLVVLGGLVVGAVVGVVASTLTAFFDDHLLEITLTTITAYGSFLLAEALHVSPVIAVLLAGLVLGNWGRDRGMSSSTQIAVNSFWEYAAFVVNSLVFLLIGIEVDLGVLVDNWGITVWAILAVLASRAAAVYTLMPIVNRFGPPVPRKWQHVQFWGGIRGALSIALVLSVPQSVSGRSQLIVMTFGVVLFTLLAQGLTISPLLKALGFGGLSESREEWERLESQALLRTAAMAELENLRHEGAVTGLIYEKLHEAIIDGDETDQKREDLLRANPELEEMQRSRFEAHLINVQKSRLSKLLRSGLISEETHHDLSAELDRKIMARE